MADAKVCPVCGKKVSGFLSVETIGPKSIEAMKIIGIDAEGWCLPCAQARLDEERTKCQAAFLPVAERLKDLEASIPDMLIAQTTPHFESQQESVVGIVSGHSVIGTGPLSTFASAFTDFFGEESLAYQQKIRDAESKAILMAKMQAVEMGASLHGMIMVTCVGTAIKTKNPSPLFQEYLDLIKKKRNFGLVQSVKISMS